MSAHDRYLAQYHTHLSEVWCEKPGCPNHTDPVTVTFVSEYGQGWYEPEECSCGGAWLDDRPDEEEE